MSALETPTPKCDAALARLAEPSGIADERLVDALDEFRAKATPDVYAKFVKVWQGASNVGEVVEAMGISKLKASAWSLRLRKAGVKLKKFRSGAFKVDVSGLNKLIET